MTDEKIEAMMLLLHQENLQIMEQLLSIRCYPKDLDKAIKHTEKNWDEVLKAVMEMK